MAPRDLSERLRRELESNEYLADIFHLLHLDEGSNESDPPRLLVPESIDVIFTGAAEDANELLMAMLSWGRRDTVGMSVDTLAALAEKIRERYRILRSREQIRPIPDETDPQIADAMETLFRTREDGGLFSRLGRAVGSAIATVLAVSRRTGRSILMRGRDHVRLIRDRIVQLELPTRADELAERKAALFRRLYGFKGGKGAKVFVGIALSGTGFFVGGPVMASAGLVLAFIDP